MELKDDELELPITQDLINISLLNHKEMTQSIGCTPSPQHLILINGLRKF